jgi:hypothetical protein
MIQVIISSPSNVQIAGAQWPDSTSATNWINQGVTNNWWGLPLRTLMANLQGVVIDLDGSTPDLTKATNITYQPPNEYSTTQVIATVTMPAQYSITQTDITAQVAAQALVQKGLQAQQLGAQVVAQVYAFNEQNLTAGTLTSANFTAMLADTSLANIERLLWNGSLATALSLMQASTTLSTYFSPTQISAIEAMITTFLG